MAARRIIAQSPIVGIPPNSITWNKIQIYCYQFIMSRCIYIFHNLAIYVLFYCGTLKTFILLKMMKASQTQALKKNKKLINQKTCLWHDFNCQFNLPFLRPSPGRSVLQFPFPFPSPGICESVHVLYIKYIPFPHFFKCLVQI